MLVGTQSRPVKAIYQKSRRSSRTPRRRRVQAAKGRIQMPPIKKRSTVICMGANTPATIFSATSMVLKITVVRRI